MSSSNAPAQVSLGDRAKFTAISLGNRPELTALRAPLAIAVLIYHQNPTVIVGAPTMVTMWAGLSGFLITSILLRDRAIHGRIGIKKFYLRRALRLLPPLYLAIIGVYIYAAFVHVGDARQRINGDVLATVFYYMDYRQAFGHEPFLGFFGHAWSLSLEEQFYFMWAPVLAFLLWRWGRKAALWFAAVGMVAVIVNREIIWSTTHYVPRVYFAFDTRMDAWFAGCILGVVFSWGHLSDVSVNGRRWLAVAGGLSTLTLVWITQYMSLYSAAPYVWGLIVVDVTCVFILAHVIASPNGRYARVLRLRPIVHIGEITYMIYICHWPVYIILNQSALPFLDSWGVFAVRLAVTVAIAEMSWFLIEKRLMKLREGRLGVNVAQS